MNGVEIELERLERELVKTGRGVALPPESDVPRQPARMAAEGLAAIDSDEAVM